MKRVIIVLLVLAVVAGGWLIYSRVAANDSRAPLEGVTTAPVIRGPLEAAVSATGNVQAERTQRLAFNTSGTVVEVLAANGEQVIAGQVLARLDETNLALSARQAEAALAVAEAQMARAQAGPSAEDIAVVEASLAIAQVGVQTAEAGVAAARANLNRAQAGASEQEVAIATRRVEEAKNALWGVQAQRDAICGRVRVAVGQAECDQAQASVQRSEEGVRIAELQLQQIKAGPRSQDVAAAQAQVTQALSQVDSARAQVARTEAELARAMRGASPEDISVAKAQVDQAQVSVEIARRRLDDTVLRAPADGRVTGLNLLVGDAVAPGTPVATLVNTDAYHIVVNIDETEIGQVEEGQVVRIVLDAYPGEPLEGQVSMIGLAGANVQGIVVYEVRIDLEPGALAIRPLMTASVDIVVASISDALLVSSRALRRDTQGRYVEIVENGALQRVDVVLGVTSIEYAQVVGGLAEGQQVVVGRPRDPLFTPPLPFGGG